MATSTAGEKKFELVNLKWITRADKNPVNSVSVKLSSVKILECFEDTGYLRINLWVSGELGLKLAYDKVTEKELYLSDKKFFEDTLLHDKKPMR